MTLPRSRPSFLRVAVAFSKGEKALAELIGPEKAREAFAEQEAVADCRRRAACNRDMLDRRYD